MLWCARRTCTWPTYEVYPKKPNLKPPVTSTEKALRYKADLEKIDPNVDYLMTLYLSPELTPDEIRKAKKAGVYGTVSKYVFTSSRS